MKNRNMHHPAAIGVDLGGSKIGAATLNTDGQIIGKIVQAPTLPRRSGEKIVNDLENCIRDALASSGLTFDQIAGVGIGAPGPIDMRRGVLLTPPNLKSLHGYPLLAEMERRLKAQILLNNDGNCFALGEAIFGGGRNMGVVCGATLGTGFGCGIVINQRIYNGATGTAAEVWNCIYKEGKFENYGSAAGVVNLYRDLTGLIVTAKGINHLAISGDANALRVWGEYGINLGEMLSYIVNVVDPDIIIIGGSVSQAWDFFIDSLEGTLRALINPVPRAHIRVSRAELGAVAGITGAAALNWYSAE